MRWRIDVVWISLQTQATYAKMTKNNTTTQVTVLAVNMWVKVGLNHAYPAVMDGLSWDLIIGRVVNEPL